MYIYICLYIKLVVLIVAACDESVWKLCCERLAFEVLRNISNSPVLYLLCGQNEFHWVCCLDSSESGRAHCC